MLLQQLQFLLLLFCATAVQAVPAFRGTFTVTQPDGAQLTLRLVGDEYLHFNTTADGYSLVRNEAGYYVYAQLEQGQLVPTAQVAHDEPLRTSEEKTFLQHLPKRLTPQMSAQRAQEQQAERQRQAKARTQHRVQQYDYTQFRGLILLIEFNDCSFSRSDYQEVINQMANQANYRGYSDTRYGFQQCTGSVRDYFYDNSAGLFDPEFDVVGPISIDLSQYSPNSSNNMLEVNRAVLNAADEVVDFSDYDRDGDGMVDMVYMIFAGAGAHYGNDSRLLWPHASQFYDYGGYYGYTYVYKDGVALGRYACSTELAGAPSYKILEGIGTICHEFGHVLGLPDEYDTDYAESGGESHHPGEWSIMAGGSYLNNSRTPAGYSLYERYAVGFAQPTLIEGEGHFTMQSIDAVNAGYRLNTQVKNEYFLIENRQQTKWNQYLPGHGMLVFRVDSTNSRVWDNNSINANPQHNYYELLRANGYTGQAAGSDPFPGTSHVSKLTNVTTPANLKSWSGTNNRYGLSNIRESGGVVTFDVINPNELSSISMPATLTLPIGLSRQLVVTHEPEEAPCVLTWQSDHDDVVSVSQEGVVTALTEGTAIITVTANGTHTAQCVVKTQLQKTAAHISAFRHMDDGDEAVLGLTDVQVLYAYGDDLYVRDSTGSLVLSQTGIVAKRNDLLNGTFYGQLSIENKVPHLRVVENISDAADVVVSEGETEVEPRVVRLSELTEDDYGDYVTLEAVTVSRKSVGGATRITANDGDAMAIITNPFGTKNASAPLVIANKYFDLTGIFATNAYGDEVYDGIYLLAAYKENKSVTTAIQQKVLPAHHPLYVYSIDGRFMTQLQTDGAGQVDLSKASLQTGLYVVRGQGFVQKVVVR